MTRHPARLLVACLTAASSMVLAGCAGELTEQDKRAAAEYGTHRQHRTGHHATGTPTPTSTLPSASYTWQELAATVGCRAKLQGRTTDFRHAVCVKDGDSFVFLDFDTVRGQRDWLEYAVIYGGIYLVGDRWVLSGRSKDYLESLRPTLGGDIEESDEHGSS